MFAGGGAINPCLRRQIEAGLGRKLYVPESPRIVAALGAALCNDEKEKQNGRRQFDAASDPIVRAG